MWKKYHCILKYIITEGLNFHIRVFYLILTKIREFYLSNGVKNTRILYTVFKLKFPIRFLKKFSGYNEAAETCNTAMERKFCGLSRDIFKKCEKFSYKAKFAFFWQEAEMANADLKSNFKSRGCLRPIWPQTYVISYLSCIYCKEMVFFGHKLIRGHFAIDQILLQKQEFLQFSL